MGCGHTLNGTQGLWSRRSGAAALCIGMVVSLVLGWNRVRTQFRVVLSQDECIWGDVSMENIDSVAMREVPHLTQPGVLAQDNTGVIVCVWGGGGGRKILESRSL